MRSIILKSINYILYLCTSALIGAGLLLQYRLPPRSSKQGMTVIGLHRHEWGEIHLYLGLFFIALCILHLFLNWSWIVKVASSKNRLLLVLSLGIGILLVISPLLFPVIHAAE